MSPINVLPFEYMTLTFILFIFLIEFQICSYCFNVFLNMCKDGTLYLSLFLYNENL